jgi:hypothetical protein
LVNEATWYKITCIDSSESSRRRLNEENSYPTSNSVRLESSTGLALSDISIIKSEEQDNKAIDIALFEQRTPKEGDVGFSCKYNGIATSENPQGSRPVCGDGMCCGHAFASWDVDNQNRLQVEVCQPVESVNYTYKPTWNSQEVEWTFECIDGA